MTPARAFERTANRPDSESVPGNAAGSGNLGRSWMVDNSEVTQPLAVKGDLGSTRTEGFEPPRARVAIGDNPLIVAASASFATSAPSQYKQQAST